MATFVSDDMTGSNGTLLTAHTGATGATWAANTVGAGTNPGPVHQIQGNRVRANTTAVWYGFASGVPAGVEYDITADYVAVSVDGYGGVTGRSSTSVRTMYQATIDSAGTGGNCFSLGKEVAAAYTELGRWNTTLTLSQSYAVKLEIRDATKKIFVDGTERVSSTDNTITAAGRVGIYGATYAASGAAVGFHTDNIVAADATATATSIKRLMLLGVG